MNFIIRILIIAVNAFLLAWLLPGIEISDFLTAILVALVLAVLDSLLKPILILLTLPATFLSFGLFLFVVNALIILLDAYFVHGFKVDGFWYAVLFSILLSIANGLVLPREKKQEQKGNW